jgi:hypothetical protein
MVDRNHIDEVKIVHCKQLLRVLYAVGSLQPANGLKYTLDKAHLKLTLLKDLTQRGGQEFEQVFPNGMDGQQLARWTMIINSVSRSTGSNLAADMLIDTVALDRYEWIVLWLFTLNSSPLPRVPVYLGCLGYCEDLLRSHIIVPIQCLSDDERRTRADVLLRLGQQQFPEFMVQLTYLADNLTSRGIRGGGEAETSIRAILEHESIVQALMNEFDLQFLFDLF